jgi:hypothetical protein
MYVVPYINFESRTNGLLRSCRSELEPSRNASGKETGHARYGSLECYCTCMVSNLSGARPGLMSLDYLSLLAQPLPSNTCELVRPFHGGELGFPLTRISRICCTVGINFSYLQFPVC